MQAKRSLLCRYLKINNEWVLIGKGFTENTTAYNPDSDDIQYINEDSKRTELKSYAPTMSLSGVIEMDGTSYPSTMNKIFEYMNNIRRNRTIETSGEILEIELYTCTAYDKVNSMFKNCKSSRNKVNFQFENFGGEAGNSISFEATINYVGDPTNTNDLYDVADNTSRTPTLSGSTIKTISYALTHVSKVFARTSADMVNGFYAIANDPLTAQFKADNSYNLPSSITITNGSSTLSSSTDYTWDNTSGLLFIKENKITDNVTITVTGTA